MERSDGIWKETAARLGGAARRRRPKEDDGVEVDVVDPRADGDDAAERRDGVEELGANADGPAAEDEDDARWVGVGGHHVE
uniref:Uncharacterized protein n=1 Tax=Oryza sativa subsp. japonica TaxID=39947 RepID=Q6YXX0_ORYSJ|nr:hypothetical protein [Oryza sativa Japonica Group]